MENKKSPLSDKGMLKRDFVKEFKGVSNPRPLTNRNFGWRDKLSLGQQEVVKPEFRGSYVSGAEVDLRLKHLRHEIAVTHDPAKKIPLQDEANILNQIKNKNK